jgi:membrane protease YdiL (CAAX protease family)
LGATHREISGRCSTGLAPDRRDADNCLVPCLADRPGTFADAANDMGLHWRLPAPEVVLWSVGMILASMVASYAIAALRRYFGGGPTAAGLDILPETPAETVVFSLVVAPTGGIGEEIVYRGFLLGQLWGITDNAWIAAFVSSAVFGGLHLYQGW